MESLAQALNIGIPIFVILIAIEFLYGYFTQNQTLNLPDTISSLSSGITNITKNVLGLIVAVLSYSWIESKIGIFDIKASWWVFVVVFIAKDFSGYWIHRFEHTFNYFWNRHIIHHSSEEFNLPCALRQSISEIFSFSILILFPLAILGIPTEVFAIIAPIHLFAQFWYHTRHIDRMGFLEHIIVTPSHHRVHHAINDIYLDKNFAQIFIVWDKWFGTFQEELADEPAVYGLKRQVNTWNPILINFQHAYLIWKDFFLTKSWKDKARIWFMPTGWRPADREAANPIPYIKDAYTQVKYMPEIKPWVLVWSSFQLIVVLTVALLFFNHLAAFTFLASLLMAAFIFLSIFSFTAIMDGERYGAYLQLVSSILGVFGIYMSMEYLSFSAFIYVLLILIASFYCISLLLSIIFLGKHSVNTNHKVSA